VELELTERAVAGSILLNPAVAVADLSATP
jgi:hypothetical protein